MIDFVKIAASIIPILIFLSAVFFLNGFAVINALRLLGSFAWGVASCLVLAIFSFLFNTDPLLFSILEEVAKFALPVMLIRKKKISFLLDLAIYTVAIGVGYALTKNAIDFYYNDSSIFEVIHLSIEVPILHLWITLIASSLLLMLNVKYLDSDKPKGNFWLFALISIIPSIIANLMDSLLPINELYSFIATIISAIATIYFMVKENNKVVSEWIEKSIIDDIELSQSIKIGEFRTTNTGKYLLKLKDKFSPERFFDIVVYVSLFTEISISIKGFLMMNDTDINIPREEKENLKNKIAELEALKKNIGNSALILLKPIADYAKIKNLVHLWS